MHKPRLMKAAAIILTLIISGCETVRYVSSPLPLPARPVLPQIESKALQCLSPETYSDLVKRDMLRRQYANNLELIIESTHKDKKP